uniref:Do family serine endopeptidase n=1 Tax=Roseihalotalea indica TaxID=2867963 RepID=A0AA49JIR8_9BACT|nr:Do family serine endopeptidase [Tunicatimonas sp. TK19036]
MKNMLTTVLAAVFASIITLTAYIYFVDDTQIIQVDESTKPAFASYIADRSTTAAPFDFTVAAEKVTPAVVHITSVQQSASASNGQQQQIPEFFRDFFGDRFQQAPQGPRMGSGSGVIISSDGYIVTNNHVVADADELTVVLVDNRSYTAQVIGTDPTTDLALIKIDEERLPSLTFANSDQVRIGEWVLAAGNPFRLNSTVTAGIVSATGRSINILQDQYAIESFIQTDAAVNPGNSGGALVDVDGNLIGINTAIASQTGSYVGYSFAVPANIAKKVVDDLREYGTVQRGFLGVQIVGINSAVAKEFDLDRNQGVLVQSVVENGSAEEAGIQEGDIIVQVDERKILQNSDLLSYIGRKRPGDSVTVTIDRGGDEKTFEMVLKTRDGDLKLAKAERGQMFEELGAEFSELSKDQLDELDISGGVQVNRVYPGRLRQADIQPGFIITRVDKQPVRSLDDLNEMLDEASNGILLEGIYPDNPSETLFYGIGLR